MSQVTTSCPMRWVMGVHPHPLPVADPLDHGLSGCHACWQSHLGLLLGTAWQSVNGPGATILSFKTSGSNKNDQSIKGCWMMLDVASFLRSISGATLKNQLPHTAAQASGVPGKPWGLWPSEGNATRCLKRSETLKTKRKRSLNEACERFGAQPWGWYDFLHQATSNKINMTNMTFKPTSHSVVSMFFPCRIHFVSCCGITWSYRNMVRPCKTG